MVELGHFFKGWILSIIIIHGDKKNERNTKIIQLQKIKLSMYKINDSQHCYIMVHVFGKETKIEMCTFEINKTRLENTNEIRWIHVYWHIHTYT